MDHHPAAPTGHNEIAQGRAKRHPGCEAPPWVVRHRPGYPAAPIRQSPERVKHVRIDLRAAGFALSGLGLFRAHESQGGASLCPGLSPCAPLGLRTIGDRQPRESTDGYNFVE